MKVTIAAAEQEAEEAAMNVYSEVEPVPMTADSEVNADVPNLPDKDVEHIKVGINRICRLSTTFSQLGLGSFWCQRSQYEGTHGARILFGFDERNRCWGGDISCLTQHL
jgi:hypothetical protein